MKAGLWFWVLLLVLAWPAQAATLKLQKQGTSPHPRLLLSWEEGQETKLETSPHSLLLKFSDLLQVEGAEAALAGVEGIKRFQYGYNSLVLELTRDYQFQVQPGTNQLVLEIAPVGIQAKLRQEQLQARTTRSQVRLWMKRGEWSLAMAGVRQLLASEPEALENLLLKVDLELQMGRPRLALLYLEEAARLAPQNEAVAELKAGLLAQGRGYGWAEAESALVEDSRHDQSLTGEWRQPASQTTFWGLWLQTRATSLEATDFTPAAQEQRWQAEAYWLENLADDQLRWSLFLGQHRLGLGASYRFWLPQGWLETKAEWAKPYWDQMQSFRQNGTRDRLALGFRQQLTPSLALNLGAAQNQTRLEQDQDRVYSVTLEGGLNLNLAQTYFAGQMLGAEPLLSLDWQNQSEETQRTEGQAQGLDWDRESKSLSLLLGSRISPAWRWMLQGGLTRDQLGQNPLFGGRITWEEASQWERFLAWYQGQDQGLATQRVTLGTWVRF